MSKKINAYGSLGFSPYTARNNNVDRAAMQSARVEQTAPSRSNGSMDERSTAQPEIANELTTAEQRMISRKFPEDPDLSLRLYGPNRDEQTINPGAVGKQLDVQG